MKMKSVMSHAFSMVPNAEIPRSSFDRSHGYKTTFDAGLLVPIFLDEALPGDTFNLSMTGFARLATPIFPVMDNMFMDTFFFAVPMRLVWENWERFNGAQDDPADTTDYTIPLINVAGNGTGVFSALQLADYFGLPLGVQVGPAVGETEVSCLPFRAYHRIWNEWFRDQNLQDSSVFGQIVDDGPDTYTSGQLALLRRGKRHDYFTSCLPWPQKGDAVELPLGTFANVVSDTATGGTGIPSFAAPPNTAGTGRLSFGAADTDVQWGGSSGTAAVLNWESTHLVTDLSTATAATINQLRQAFQVQRLFERDARGGTRYTEIIRAHFGVTSPDARLQRPEYLGGGSSRVNIVAVPQTSESAETPQGNLSAYGVASLHGHGFVKSFTEHCILIGMVCVRADLTYQQGLERMWSRQTRFDFYWPALSHIGEQAVLRKELVCDGNATTDEEVFGYQERYAEYRYKPTRITGLFRSSHPQSLDAWHLSQELAAPVTLNAAFIQDDPPIDRIIAVPAEPHFLFDAYFQLKCARPMPMYGVPGLIDHF